MSTLSLVSRVFPCRCGRVARTGLSFTGPTICEHCRTAGARQILSDVKALIVGAAPFDGLSLDQRAEHLAALLYTVESRPQPSLNVASLSDDALISIIDDPSAAESEIEAATAELAFRLASPSPAERDEIEMRIEAEAEPYPAA